MKRILTYTNHELMRIFENTHQLEFYDRNKVGRLCLVANGISANYSIKAVLVLSNFC